MFVLIRFEKKKVNTRISFYNIIGKPEQIHGKTSTKK